MFESLPLLMLRVPAILIALTFHELSHGYVAKALGDPTAESEGRLTLNPLAHLDPFGAAMLLLGPFGWAKPVPVNPIYFTDPMKGMAVVAAAGPAANLLMAALTGLFFKFGVVSVNSGLGAFLFILFIINIGLAVFNLLPIYPLDGSRIVMAFLKGQQLTTYVEAMRVVPMIFLGMIVVEWMFKIPILSRLFGPVFKLAYKLFIT
ncbi:site-2 protease family protein [Thermodesulfobacteriota bacterium]